MDFNLGTNIAGLAQNTFDGQEDRDIKNGGLLQQMYAKQQQMDFDQQNNPLKLAHQQGLNAQNDAQLPGIVADSEMKQRKNTNEGTFNADAIAQHVAQNDVKTLQMHAQKLEAKGQLLMGAAADAAAAPLGAAQRLRQQFAEQKLPWNDEWDRLGPGELPKRLNEMGTELMATAPKLYQAKEIQRQKGEQAEERTLINERASDYRTDNRKVGGGTPKTPTANGLEKDVVMWKNMATAAEQRGDTAAAEKYRAEADKSYELWYGARQAGQAAPPKAGAVDINAVSGVATNPTPPRPSVSKQTPAAAPQANKQGWKLHVDAKGNKAYVSPDGKQFEEVK